MIVRLQSRQQTGLRVSAAVNSLTNQRRYAALWTQLRASTNGSRPALSVLGVIACDSCKPSAAVAAGLATAAADNQNNVLLIDVSGPRSPLTRWLKLRTNCGVADLMDSSADVADVIRSDAAAEGLAFAVWGHARDSASRCADLQRWEQVIAEARDQYDLVVVALPPATEASPGAALGAVLDGVLLAIEAERTSATGAKRAQRMLERTHAHVLGAVLHNCRNYLPRWLRRKL